MSGEGGGIFGNGCLCGLMLVLSSSIFLLVSHILEGFLVVGCWVPLSLLLLLICHLLHFLDCHYGLLPIQRRWVLCNVLGGKQLFLKNFAFFIPIQPILSHSFRCFVSPFMTYFESILITSGQNVGILEAA